jgi:CHAT domain
MAGDYEEALERLAKHLGKNKIRRRVFDEIYGRVRQLRSKKEIMVAAGIAAKGNNAQQVQNALEHLAKHHLIAREKNSRVGDDARFVYGKEESVRANRDKIVRLADNPGLADRTPTKRRPLVRGVVELKRTTTRALKTRKKLVVLYLAANPDEANSLRIDAEVRSVQEALRGSVFRDNVQMEYRPAADLNSLINGLNDHRPQIVHFSGHGHEKGIATDTGKAQKSPVKELAFDLLAKALAATDSPPQIVVLNSCKSSGAKKALLPVVKILVSMRDTVTDIAAMAFATQFYAALASGQSVKAAVAQGAVAVEAVSISEFDTPELLHKSETNPANIVLT